MTLHWVSYVVFGAIVLFAGVIYLGVLTTEARQVRDGHPPTRWWRAVVMRRSKDDQRTPEEFAAKYRSALTRSLRIGLGFGAPLLLLAVASFVFEATPNRWLLFFGMMLLFQGVGCFRARRILDAPQVTDTARP
jgi:hypothetical protein